MHVEFLVEEPSAEAALVELLPNVVGRRASWQIHTHQGKTDLMAKLTGRLRGYACWLPTDWHIVVLIDEDRQDCRELKRKMEDAARAAGLRTRGTRRGRERVHVVNRIAVEELEARFFGDVPALCAAYPGVPDTLEHKRGFRDSDAIAGGTWEALERVLQRAGHHHRGGLPKIEAARAIARHMDPARNRSRSFQCFRAALLDLLAAEAT
jgi:glycosyltransferase involved in cell wall biosynthesis